MIEIVWYKNVQVMFQFVVLVMDHSSEQSTGLVFSVCTLNFIPGNELIIFTEIKVDNDWLRIETFHFIFEWQRLVAFDKIMKYEMLQYHIDCVKDICYISFQFHLFKMASLFTCLSMLVTYDRLILTLKLILTNSCHAFKTFTWNASL